MRHLAFRVDQVNFNSAPATLRQKRLGLKSRITRLLSPSTFMIQLDISLSSQPTDWLVNKSG